MSNTNHFPLSGAVTQTINPVEFWIKSVSTQMGFVNIHNTCSSDHKIEQRIIEDTASYGRQLGKINDLLATVINKPDLNNLSYDEQLTIDEFRKMNAEIEAVKSKYKTPETLLSSIDTMITEIRKLKVHDPDTHDIAMSRLTDGLGLRPG